jgi:hypothetical protein
MVEDNVSEFGAPSFAANAPEFVEKRGILDVRSAAVHDDMLIIL